MSTYREEYEVLTDKQRQAVEFTEGPLLVIAGPGTGKTQLLSMRVARILEVTDTSPDNILCLTFTNKASANMRSRLQRLVGAEAMGANIKTFHSFAAEIMNEYPSYFWNGARLTVAPDALQTDIIEGILTSLPLDNPLAMKFVGRFTGSKDVKAALKLTKEAGLTPEKLRAVIHANMAFIDILEPEIIDIFSDRLSYGNLPELLAKFEQLPDHPIDPSLSPLMSLTSVLKEAMAAAVAADEGTNKTANTGKLKSSLLTNEAGVKGMHKQRKSNEWWLHLADVYEQYLEELAKRGCYDYADMLIEVINQLEQNPSMLADIQERYHYLLIDEFQDSNAAQMRLANLVANSPAAEGKPNIMAVGDDDQSIYKFNGAELNNMLRFRTDYRGDKEFAETIVLEKNFRSNQAVLDASKQIIELSSDRIVKRHSELSKDLVAKNPPEDPGLLEHRSYPSAEYQYYGIAKDIQSRHQANSEQTVAVLARNHDTLRTMASQLNSLGVPIAYEQQNNILEHGMVKQIIAICRVLNAIAEGDQDTVNIGLAEVVSHPVWQLDRLGLWHLAIKNRYNQQWLDSLLESEDPTLQQFGHWIVWLSGRSSEVGLPIIIDYILGLRDSDNYTSPIRTYLTKADPRDFEYVQTLSAVQKLRGAAGEFHLGNDNSLDGFIRFIDLHIANNLVIADTSVFATSPDAVQLMTVHGAKGLEFDAVYLVDAMEGDWQPKKKGRKAPLNLPLQPYGDDMDDYIRLMYVAITRAKHTFIANSFRLNAAGEEAVSTPLISEALPLKKIGQSDLPDTAAVLEGSVVWPDIDITDARQILAPVLQDFTLHVTALQKFLDVSEGGPIPFRDNNLLRLPGSRSIILAYGTAIHSALEEAQRLINTDKYDIGRVKTKFEEKLRGEPVLPQEIERYVPKGLQLLDSLLGEGLITLNKDDEPETNLTGIDIDGAIIGGKLDHIAKAEDSITISDYKTGTGLSSFDSQNKALQVKIWKHRLQLVFYALLAQNHPRYKGKNIQTQMLYVESDRPEAIRRSINPTPEEIDRVAHLARAVYQHIVDYNLPDISGYTKDIDGIRQFEQDLLDGKI